MSGTPLKGMSKLRSDGRKDYGPVLSDVWKGGEKETELFYKELKGITWKQIRIERRSLHIFEIQLKQITAHCGSFHLSLVFMVLCFDAGWTFVKLCCIEDSQKTILFHSVTRVRFSSDVSFPWNFFHSQRIFIRNLLQMKQLRYSFAANIARIKRQTSHSPAKRKWWKTTGKKMENYCWINCKAQKMTASSEIYRKKQKEFPRRHFWQGEFRFFVWALFKCKKETFDGWQVLKKI